MCVEILRNPNVLFMVYVTSHTRNIAVFYDTSVAPPSPTLNSPLPSSIPCLSFKSFTGFVKKKGLH